MTLLVIRNANIAVQPLRVAVMQRARVVLLVEQVMVLVVPRRAAEVPKTRNNNYQRIIYENIAVR